MNLFEIKEKLNLGIPLTNIKLRVTEYCRVSTKNKEQKNSLKNQIDHFDKMIKDNPNWTYIPGYIDNGITGTSDIKRNNFIRMIEDAKHNKFDLIITKEISRFSRNTLDSIKYTRELLDYGVAVLFVNDNINTALPDSELRLTIMASLAQDEIRRLSERVKFGMKEAINKGIILGSNRIYGYKKSNKSKNLIIIKEEAKIILKIFTMYALNNYSLNKIATELNNSNILTPNNKLWNSTAIRRIIKNPKYKGYYCANKSETVNYMTKKVKINPITKWVLYKDNDKIPPIISEKLWKIANERLNTRGIKYGIKNNEKYKFRYPFSLKIYCSEHNKIFRRRKNNNVMWSCSVYINKGVNFCQTPHINEEHLYNIFKIIYLIILKEMKSIKNDLIKLYKKYINMEEELNKFIIEKNKLQQKHQQLINLLLDNIITKEEYKKENTKNRINLDKINNNINQIKNSLSSSNFSLIIKQLNSYTISLNFISKLIDISLNKIIVSKLDNDRNNIKLDIYLNIEKEILNKYNFPNIFTFDHKIYNINIYSSKLLV